MHGDGMERRLHPTHDRAACRLFPAFAAVLLLGGVCAAARWLGWPAEWPVAVLGCLFFAFVATLLVQARRINRCPCPACGKLLRRPPDTTEFVCADCRVVWWTRAFGSSFWDWFA